MVDQSIQEHLTEYLELHPDVLDLVLSKALNAFKVDFSYNNIANVKTCFLDPINILRTYLNIFPDQAAQAAKRARELVRQKSVLRSSSLPGKLADCSSTNPEECGIFLSYLSCCICSS